MQHKTKVAGPATVGVIGLGYVGLPLAVLAGSNGLPVAGVDHDRARVASLCQGKSYVSDISDRELQALSDSNLVEFSTDSNILAFCDIIVVCVPTPLSGEGKPDYSCLIRAADDIARVLRRGQLIIVESTVAPGTTESVILPRLAAGGLTAGRDYYLAYSPERIDPGNRVYKVNNIPKLVAGISGGSRTLACRFYEALGLSVVPVRSLATAEMAKLLENTYRDVNIALINEMAQICRAGGINIWDVVAAAATKPFGYQPFYPGPGVGGHCVPVDSVYYADWARNIGKPASLAEYARKINAEMPQYAAEMVRQALKASGKDVRGSRVLVMGVTYKKDTNDVRESAALELLKLLEQDGANVCFHDPNVEAVFTNSRLLTRISLDGDTVAGQDCVILAVAHSTYEFSSVVSASGLLVDLTNSLAGYDGGNIVRL